MELLGPRAKEGMRGPVVHSQTSSVGVRVMAVCVLARLCETVCGCSVGIKPVVFVGLASFQEISGVSVTPTMVVPNDAFSRALCVSVGLTLVVRVGLVFSLSVLCEMVCVQV